MLSAMLSETDGSIDLLHLALSGLIGEIIVFLRSGDVSVTHLFHDKFLINVSIQKGGAISLSDFMHRPSRDPQSLADHIQMLVESVASDPLAPVLKEKFSVRVKILNHPQGILCRVRDN